MTVDITAIINGQPFTAIVDIDRIDVDSTVRIDGAGIEVFGCWLASDAVLCFCHPLLSDDDNDTLSDLLSEQLAAVL